MLCKPTAGGCMCQCQMWWRSAQVQVCVTHSCLDVLTHDTETRGAHRNFQQNEREGIGKGHVSQPIQHVPHLVGLGGLWGTGQGPMVGMMLCISNIFLTFTPLHPQTSRLDNSRGRAQILQAHVQDLA